MIYKPRSEYALNVGRLSVAGVELTPDEFNQTLLMNDRPIVIPGGYNGVILASEAGMPLPHFYSSLGATGTSLSEQYNPSAFNVTGWGVFCSQSGLGPGHLTSGYSGDPIMSPLTGRIYMRSPLDPSGRIPMANFWINSGEYYREEARTPIIMSGKSIIGIDMYSGLSGIEDISVVLFGNYYDVTPANEDDGVVMSSGDASISFYTQYAYTGLAINEYYNPHDFVANRWAIYASTTGSGPDANISGRFYYRSPYDSVKTTITDFSLPTGSIANYSVIDDFTIPWRKIVGMDIYNSLTDAQNVNIVLGGKSISSASYFKSIITSEKFLLFSGFMTGLISDRISGVSMLNEQVGAIGIFGQSGILVETSGQNIYLSFTGAAFDPYALGFVDQSQTGIFATTADISGLSGVLNSKITGLESSLIAASGQLSTLNSGTSGVLYEQITGISGFLKSGYTEGIRVAATGLQGQIEALGTTLQTNIENTGASAISYAYAISGVLNDKISSASVGTVNGLSGDIGILPSGALKTGIIGNDIYFDIDSGVLDGIYVEQSQTGQFYPSIGNPSGFVLSSQTGSFATYSQLTDVSGYLDGRIASAGATINVTGGSNMSAVTLSGIGGAEVIQSGEFVLISGGASSAPPSSSAASSISFYSPFSTTGMTLQETYISSNLTATGFLITCFNTGLGGIHLSSGASGLLVISPLTGSFYQRSIVSNPTYNVCDFSLNSGLFYNRQSISATITGGNLFGINVYSGLSGITDIGFHLLCE